MNDYSHIRESFIVAAPVLFLFVTFTHHWYMSEKFYYDHVETALFFLMTVWLVYWVVVLVSGGPVLYEQTPDTDDWPIYG